MKRAAPKGGRKEVRRMVAICRVVGVDLGDFTRTDM